MYQNRASLIGFLGKDAETKTTRNNAHFTVLSLATKRTWKNKSTGERAAETTWHRCIAWGTLGEFAASLTKGAHLLVEGEIRTREYTANNAKRCITEVHVANIQKLDRTSKTNEAAA